MRLLLLAAFSAILLHAGGAAADDCPPGSVQKNQDSFGWCEPTVCQTDAQCGLNEVCRNVPLCMQVGNVASPGASPDAGQRLVVTQRCAPDKSCPQTTVCSDLGRCLSRNAAEKMGVLAPPVAAPVLGPDKKSSCGCETVGARARGGAGGGALVLLGLALLSSRRSGSRARVSWRD